MSVAKRITEYTGMGLLAFAIFVGLCLLQLAATCILTAGLIWAAGHFGWELAFWPTAAVVFILSILFGGR